LSKTISYLRFPLIIGVVFIHFNLAKNGFMMQIENGFDYPDWFYYIIFFFSDVLPRIGVPLFFFFSGFLFFYRKDFNNKVYKQKLHTRAATLLLPYFLWNTIAILIKVFRKLPFLSSVFPNAYKTEILLSPERLIKTFFANLDNEGIFITSIVDNAMTVVNKTPFPINVPLWYVRDLIIMVILSPILFGLIKKGGVWFIAVLGVIWYIIKPLFLQEGGYPVLFFTAAFFFSFGAYFSIKKVNFIDYMRKAQFFPYLYFVFVIADTLTKKYDYNIYIHEAGILIGVVSAIIITSVLLEKRKVTVNMTLSNCSFFVFALHTLIMSDVATALLTIFHFSGNTYSMLLLYFMVPTITILICILAFIFLKRYIPKVCNILTGGR